MHKEQIDWNKRVNTIDAFDSAIMNVRYKHLLLKRNLTEINSYLETMKEYKKIIRSFRYIIKHWAKIDVFRDNEIKAEQKLLHISNLYKEAILKRKLLKYTLKQAERKLTKKQKRLAAFNKKYPLGKNQNGKR